MSCKPIEPTARPSCSWAVFCHKARKVYAVRPTLRQAQDVVTSAFPHAQVQRLLPGFSDDTLMGPWGYTYLESQVAKDLAQAST